MKPVWAARNLNIRLTEPRPFHPAAANTEPTRGDCHGPVPRDGWLSTFCLSAFSDIHPDKNHNMNKTITLIFGFSILFLAGCCTTTHVTKWEYKVAVAPHTAPAVIGRDPTSGSITNVNTFFEESSRMRRDNDQNFLNNLGEDGWELIKEEDGIFYFKRPIK